MKLHYRSNLTAGIVALTAAPILFLIIPEQIAVEAKVVHGVSSRTLPYILAALMAVCGVGLIIQSLVFKKDEVKELDLGKEAFGLLYMLLLLAYGIGFSHSFIISTGLLGVVTLAFTKCKKPIYYAIVAATVITLYFIFTRLLHVRLP